MSQYISIDDLLEAVSEESQGKLTNDPTRAFLIGIGDGSTLTFDTPFLRASSITAFVDDVIADPQPTLSRGTGADGVDQVTFTVAPADDDVISGKGDTGAAVRAILLKACVAASNEVDLRLPGTPLTDVVLIEKIKPAALTYARWILRRRRALSETDSIITDLKRADRALERIAEGITVFTGTSGVSATRKISVSSDDIVFGDDAAVL